MNTNKYVGRVGLGEIFCMVLSADCIYVHSNAYCVHVCCFFYGCKADFVHAV